MVVQTLENVIEEIIDATRNGTCQWDGNQRIYGFYSGKMHDIDLILWNLQDETPSLVFDGYGTYKGGQILRNLISAVLDHFPDTVLRYPSHASLPDPTALLSAWTKPAFQE